MPNKHCHLCPRYRLAECVPNFPRPCELALQPHYNLPPPFLSDSKSRELTLFISWGVFHSISYAPPSFSIHSLIFLLSHFAHHLCSFSRTMSNILHRQNNSLFGTAMICIFIRFMRFLKFSAVFCCRLLWRGL